MFQTVKQKLEAASMFDCAIIEHHFTPYMRDYDIIVDVPSAIPGGTGSYIAERCRYRFTHCVLAEITTAVTDETWRVSWGDEMTDCEVWEQAGKPDGYLWGVGWMDVYPGLTTIDDSDAARAWAERLNQPMHEVTIETNCCNFRLIFHDVIIEEIAIGDPETNQLTPL